MLFDKRHTCLSVAGFVTVYLGFTGTALASSITASDGNISSGFTNGQILTSATVLSAQSGQPAPFNGPCGSDASSNCSTFWIFNYVVPSGESVTAADLTLGIFDLDSHASGNQIALYQIVGGDVLTSAFNTAAEAKNGGGGTVNNEYDVFTFTLSNLAALDSGTATIQLTLQGPGIGVLGTTTFNGASPVFSTLDLTTEPTSGSGSGSSSGTGSGSGSGSGNALVPEPTSLLLVASGLGAAFARARRKTIK